MKSIARYALSIVVLAAAAGAIVWAMAPEPVSVDVATIERGRLRVTIDEDGKTRIRERFIVSAPLAGRLLRIELDPGDSVEAGKSLLAAIKPRDPDLLDPRAVALAEAQVQAAAASVEKIGPMIEQARQTQAFAEEELARANRLQARNAIGKEEHDETVLKARHAAEQLRSARIAEEIAKFELQQAKAALIRSRPDDVVETNSTGLPVSSDDAENGDDDNAETNLASAAVAANQDFRIHSPINGRVLRVFQESAAVVAAGTPLLELGEPTDLEVVVDVLSQDAVQIAPGDRVLLEHWGGDRPLEARVRLVEPAGFTKISALGVEEQRVNVVIDLVPPPEERVTLGDGFRVEARIITWESDDVLQVPTSALFRHGDDWAVFRIADGVAKRTIVKLGKQNGLSAEVLDGLKEGDQTVVHPSDAVTDGVRIVAR